MADDGMWEGPLQGRFKIAHEDFLLSTPEASMLTFHAYIANHKH